MSRKTSEVTRAEGSLSDRSAGRSRSGAGGRSSRGPTVLVASCVLALAACTSTDGGGSASSSGAPGTTDAPAEEYHFGEVVQVAPQTLMVVGRELAVEKGEADIANSILFKDEDVVYWIDSGATAAFVGPLRQAFDQLKPYAKVVLVNTHGHVEHVGNNALLNELGAASVEHYIPQAEIAKARDYLQYFTGAFTPVAPYIESFADPAAGAAKLMTLFEPLNVETGVMTTLESRPFQEIIVGSTRWTGWTFGDGAIQLLRAQGHTEGEVIVYIPGIKLLHLADEDNSYYPVFPGNDLVKTETLFAKTLAMVNDGVVELLTDGHSFTVRDPQQAKAFLENRLASAVAFDQAIHRILAEHPQGITVPELVTEFGKAPEMAEASGSAQRSVLFDTLQVVAKLDELGIVPVGSDPATAIVALPTSA